VAGQFHLDAETYLALVRAELPRYDELQEQLAETTADVAASSILDLGSGTGVTAAHVVRHHPDATLTGVDASDEMLCHAREALPGATFVAGRLEDPLPAGPFDLVVSAFAVHHLTGRSKADLFRRVAQVLRPGGRFVLCDVVVPTGSVADPVPLEDGVDLPDSVADQATWLAAAGLRPSVVLADGDLAILRADAPDPTAAVIDRARPRSARSDPP
jgi:tRNA (cmo5U34)-methyltransferase